MDTNSTKENDKIEDGGCRARVILGSAEAKALIYDRMIASEKRMNDLEGRILTAIADVDNANNGRLTENEFHKVLTKVTWNYLQSAVKEEWKEGLI